MRELPSVKIKERIERPATSEELDRLLKFFVLFLKNDRGVHPKTGKPLTPEWTEDEEIEEYNSLKEEIKNVVYNEIKLENGDCFRFFYFLNVSPMLMASMRNPRVFKSDLIFFYNTIQICDNGDLVYISEDEVMNTVLSKEDYKAQVNSTEPFESVVNTNNNNQ